MSNQQHTHEPWAWFETEDGSASCVAEGMAVARCDVHDPFGQDAINARRIAACVNSCAGIPTERLEEFNDWSAAGVASAETYRQQRDELLEALEDVKIYLQDTQAQRHIYDRVIKTIAIVKGTPK